MVLGAQLRKSLCGCLLAPPRLTKQVKDLLDAADPPLLCKTTKIWRHRKQGASSSELVLAIPLTTLGNLALFHLRNGEGTTKNCEDDRLLQLCGVCLQLRVSEVLPRPLRALIAEGVVEWASGLVRHQESYVSAACNSTAPAAAAAAASSNIIEKMTAGKRKRPRLEDTQPNQILRFADFFAGIGGFRVGLEALGCKTQFGIGLPSPVNTDGSGVKACSQPRFVCAASCELDQKATATYSSNFSTDCNKSGHVPHFRDICQLGHEALPPFDVLTVSLN